MRNIVIEKIEKSIEEQTTEIVERKGIGHPDTICDLCCEAASRALSQYYLKNFGKVLHHNLDKGIIVPGKAEPKFGGGKLLKKIKLIINGQATDKVGNKKIPVKKICKESITETLCKNLQLSEKEVKKIFDIKIIYNPGAAELVDGVETAKANDTSFGVSHAPLSKTEKLVVEVANLLNSEEFRKNFPSIGKDIKVMALRQNNFVKLMIAIAFISKYVSNLEEYFKTKETIKKEILKKFSDFSYKLDIAINALDNNEAKSEKDVYLTVTGLSAEQGDSGQVGRGNRVNGLITPCREMSLEAAAGKNINHPGKLYQILSYIVANEIAKLPGVKECEVKILSKIGSKLDEPQIINVRLLANSSINIEEVKKTVNDIFDKLQEIQKDIVFGKYNVC
ncbi:MAG: methionine adenosyltransferase [Candidatus Pacearchaeota archaeon]